jgi:hypothetical protein
VVFPTPDGNTSILLKRRKVGRYQGGNQKTLMEEGQTLQCPKEKGRKDKL